MCSRPEVKLDPVNFTPSWYIIAYFHSISFKNKIVMIIMFSPVKIIHVNKMVLDYLSFFSPPQ